MKTETRELVKDNKGTEYYLIKANRVNWVVERVSDGARLQGNARLFTYVGMKEVEAAPIDPRIRIGAKVKVAPASDILTLTKFTNYYNADTEFFIMGFGKGPGEFKIINVGGNERNTYWNIHGKNLVIA